MLKPTETVEKSRKTFACGAILQAELSKSKMKYTKMEICPEPSKSDTELNAAEIHSSPVREPEMLLEFLEEDDEKHGFEKFLQ
jgi:hypothetical protein